MNAAVFNKIKIQMNINDEKKDTNWDDGRYVIEQIDSKNFEKRPAKAKDWFIVAGIIAIILMPFVLFFKAFFGVLKDIFKDSIRIKVIIWITVILITFFIINKVKKGIRLAKAVESGKAIKREVKIIDFIYKSWGENSESGYHIVLSDWERQYTSKLYKGSKIMWKTEDQLKKDKFYEKNWIVLNIQDRVITKKQLAQRIYDLELQKQNQNFFRRLQLDSEITELTKKMDDLEEYHLHTSVWDFYIWGLDKVLIDPDDANNYILESEKNTL